MEEVERQEVSWEFSILNEIVDGIDKWWNELVGDIEAEVVYGELVKVSSKNNEVVIEFKDGNQWQRRRVPVSDEFDDEDWEDLADNIGEEGRFFIEDGELEEYEFEGWPPFKKIGPSLPLFFGVDWPSCVVLKCSRSPRGVSQMGSRRMPREPWAIARPRRKLA